MHQGVVRMGVVVLPKQARLPEGTPVVVMPHEDWERTWLTISQAARIFEVSPSLLRRWVRSGKVRVQLENSRLIHAGDVEDEVEQNNLLTLTMQVAERD